MIRVEPAPEPADFDRKVRQPGLSAIAELVGEKPLVSRPGPRRKKRANRREDIPSSEFPAYWTVVIDDLLLAYHRICAYVSVYIEPVVGIATVDHMIPKSSAWDNVYEWRNYRLACPLMNSRKGMVSVVLDPFEVEDGWFALDLVSFQVVPGVDLAATVTRSVTDCIDRLRLNGQDCLTLRKDYAVNYWEGDISFAYLKRRAPFVAMELRRQGRVREGDS